MLKRKYYALQRANLNHCTQSSYLEYLLCWVQFNQVHWLRLALSKGLNRVGVSFPSPEDVNRSSFRNVVFSSYLEFLMKDTVHEPSDSQNQYLLLSVEHVLTAVTVL
jgi:hypothetical protein